MSVTILVEDQGGDCRGADVLIDVDFLDRVCYLKLRQWCLHHVVALIVKKQLRGLSDYWNRLAKMVNVLRTGAVASAVHDVAHANTPGLPRRAFTTLPRRPLKDKWGYTTRCEAWFFLHDIDLVRNCIASVLTERVKQSARRAPDAADAADAQDTRHHL